MASTAIIPQEIIDVANAYAIPLFAIKREAKFREIIQTIAAVQRGTHIKTRVADGLFGSEVTDIS